MRILILNIVFIKMKITLVLSDKRKERRKEGRETESFYQQKEKIILCTAVCTLKDRTDVRHEVEVNVARKGEQGKVFRGLYDTWVYCQIVLDVQISQR